MIKWNEADDCDKVLLKAFLLLYENNEKLLHHILNPNLPKLRTSSDLIKARSTVFSSGEQLLIRIGLDAWNGSGGIHFNELYEKLDSANFQRVLLFLNYLYYPS
jgi:hypothetical protein